MISYRKMPILRSAFQLGKQTSDHPRHSVSQISSADETTNGLMCESMTKSCGVSNRNENSNIVEITASNPDSPVWDQTSDYFFLGKDQELVEVLHSHGCYESEEGMLKRRGIVSELETLVKQWIRSVGLSKGLGWRLVEEAEGRLLTYGSYRLGAVSRDGDIDVLCVAPEHVDRNDFFDSLYSLLEKRSEDITELRCLSEAFVPVIKMRFKGIEVDLTFASLHCRKIPNEDRFLQLEPIGHLDPRCHHSLNGYRATLEILDLVPDIPSFLVALRAVKLWAKKNGIYGNILGFPGGFSWAILVVKTCQENKGASPSELISRFFQTWTSWRWPEPVYIRPPGLQPHPAWNPDLNPVDASHCMPILTPTTPQINSTNLVTASTLQVIRARLLRSLRVCEDISAGREDWNSLFQGPCFFREYKDFLMVAGSCEFGYATLYGLIESQLRHLKDHLEREYGVNAAQIWPIAFNREDGISLTRMWFLGVEMQSGHDVGSIQQSVKLFQDVLLAKLNRSKYNKTMSVTVHPVRERNLSEYITEEEMELPERKKRSYTAVTWGLTEDEKRHIPATSVQDMPDSQTPESLTSLLPENVLKVTFPTTDDYGGTEDAGIKAPALEMQNLKLSPKIPAAAAAPVSFQSADAPTDRPGLYQATTIDPSVMYQAPTIPPPTDPSGLSQALPTPSPIDRAGLYQALPTPHKIQLANANYQQPSMHQFFRGPPASTSSPKVKEDKTTQTFDENHNKYSKDGSRRSDQDPYQNRQISSSERTIPDRKPFSRPHFNSNNNVSRNYNRNAPNGYERNRSFPSKTYSRNNKQNAAASVDEEARLRNNSVVTNPEDKRLRNNAVTNPEEAKLQNNGVVANPEEAKLRNNGVATKPMPYNNDITQSIPMPSPTVNEGWVHSTSRPASDPAIPQHNFSVPPPQLNSFPLANSFVVEKRNSLVEDKNASLLGQILQEKRYLPSNNNHTSVDSEKAFSKGAVHVAEGNARSRLVSNSSDNYSPSNVTGAQFLHDQHSPKSPMWGVDPFPLVPDMSVPPPNLSVNNSRTQLSLTTENARTSRPITQVASMATENTRGSRPSQPVSQVLSLATENSRISRPSQPVTPSLATENSRISRPSLATENSRASQPITNSNPRPSFATAMAPSNVNRQRNTPRRISESEIRDAPVPKPVNIPKKKNIR